MAVRPIVHILYSGLGGQASVALALAKAGQASIPQCLAFHGVEPVHAHNQAQAEAAGLTWRGFLKTPGFSVASHREMAAWITSLQPQAVIVHSPAALLAMRAVRKRTPDVRIIAVEHHSNALKSASKWLLSASCFWLADRVVYLTETYREEVRRNLRGLFRGNKVSVIPNGIAIPPSPVLQNTEKALVTIGMQGRFVGGKDFPVLIRAIGLANAQPGLPLRLELAGDGPRRAEFEELTKQLQLTNSVHFLGMLPAAHLQERLQQWQIYAHATEGETMSLAIMEAQAAGLPVVASNVSGIPPFISEGQDGFLVEGKSPPALAAALRRLADDPELAQHFGKAARAKAEQNYSLQRMWEGYQEMLFQPNH